MRCVLTTPHNVTFNTIMTSTVNICDEYSLLLLNKVYFGKWYCVFGVKHRSLFFLVAVCNNNPANATIFLLKEKSTTLGQSLYLLHNNNVPPSTPQLFQLWELQNPTTFVRLPRQIGSLQIQGVNKSCVDPCCKEQQVIVINRGELDAGFQQFVEHISTTVLHSFGRTKPTNVLILSGCDALAHVDSESLEDEFINHIVFARSAKELHVELAKFKTDTRLFVLEADTPFGGLSFKSRLPLDTQVIGQKTWNSYLPQPNDHCQHPGEPRSHLQSTDG